MSNGRKKNFAARHQLVDANLKKAAYKQAYLMAYMDTLVQPLQENTNPSRFVKLLKTENHSDAVVNRLTISPDVMAFMEGRPIDYSQLVPHIEIYKVYVKGGKDIAEVLFPFSSFTDFENDWTDKNMLESPFRGRDAGIESVTMQMEGKGKNTVNRWMQKVTIKFVFNDVKTLFKEWSAGALFGHKHSVQYSDLFRYAKEPKGGETKKTVGSAAAAPFRIRLSIGWNVNPDNPLFKLDSSTIKSFVSSLGSTSMGGNFVNAARNSKLNWIGELIKHEMEFRENGSVGVTVTYYGALEHAFSNVRADILKNYNFETGENVKALKEQLNEIELTFWQAAAKKAKGSQKKRMSDLLQLKTAAAKLDAISAKINKLILKAKGDSPYVNILPRLDRDYNFFREALDGNGSTMGAISKVNDLDKATKNIPADSSAPANAQTSEKAVDSKLRKAAPSALQKKQRRQYQKQLQKAKNAILTGLEALEANMRAKHLFRYLELLMAQDKVAWITTTGKNKAFQNWIDYRQLLDEQIAEAAADAAADKEWWEEEGKLAWVNMTEKARAAEYNGLSPERKKFISDAGFGPTTKETPKSKKTNAGKVDTKSVAAKIRKAMEKQKRTLTITSPDGDPIIISTFKKLGATSELFLSGEYVPGDKVMFFTLGDLISVIFENGGFGVSLEQSMPDFRLILGNMNVRSVNASDTQSVSLYMLPIAVETFISFIAQKVVGEGRDSGGYALLDFVQDLLKFIMNKVVAPTGPDGKMPALAMPDLEQSKFFRIELTPIVIPKKFVQSNIHGGVHTNAVLDLSQKTRGKYSAAQSMSINQMSNTLLLTAPSSRPFAERIKRVHRADPVLDREEGIPHFMVGGPNRGLLKSIKFSESKNDTFAMAVYQRAEAGGLTSRRGMIKPARFFADLVLVGNPYFYVGQYIYVNTDLISNGHFAEELLMNGGYYIVMSVHNNIGQNKWETKINAKLEIADVVIKNGALSDPVTKLKDKDTLAGNTSDERYEALLKSGKTPQEAAAINLKYMQTRTS